MVLAQYANLLLHKSSDVTIEVIGEDSRTQNTDITDGAFSEVVHFRCPYKLLRKLPSPSGFLLRLHTIDISGCSEVTKVPAEYGNASTITTLNISGTKISAIPLSFSRSVACLDVSNCRRLTNVGDLPSLVVLNCSNSTVVDITATTLSSLQHLFALHTKLSMITAAPALQTVLWSPVLSTTLHLSDCPSLRSVLTTSSREQVNVDNAAVYVASVSGV